MKPELFAAIGGVLAVWQHVRSFRPARRIPSRDLRDVDRAT